MYPQRKSHSRICFIGDAFTVGAGDETALGWVGRLARNEWNNDHDITIYNLGVRGNSCRQIAPRWRNECELRLPENSMGRLVFMFGGNDAKEVVGQGVEVTLDDAAEIAEEMMSEASQWLPTLWIGMIPMNEQLPYPLLLPGAPQFRFSNARQSEYNETYKKIANKLGIPFLDLHSQLLEDSRWMDLTQRGDGSNPAGEGYAYIADRISAWSAWRAWFD
ncbi:GDSL-type esterase/lipase family protein [Hoeflea sp. CAU 1731]